MCLLPFSAENNALKIVAFSMAVVLWPNRVYSIGPRRSEELFQLEFSFGFETSKRGTNNKAENLLNFFPDVRSTFLKIEPFADSFPFIFGLFQTNILISTTD